MVEMSEWIKDPVASVFVRDVAARRIQAAAVAGVSPDDVAQEVAVKFLGGTYHADVPEAYARRATYNLLNDHLRHLKVVRRAAEQQRSAAKDGIATPAAGGGGRGIDAAAMRSAAQGQRRLLDHARTAWAKGRHVDHYAVVLMRLRLIWERRLPPMTERAKLKERLVCEILAPWNEEEATRSFRKPWRPIGKLWQATWTEHGPSLPDDRTLCPRWAQWQATTGAPVGRFTEATWYQWVCRGGKKLETLISSEDWQANFAPSFRRWQEK